ncbi:MAG: hypothetical protein MUC97_01065 [Bernardetiaceae bacterium]|nr:hypothetical protein [Bernardetiaceae bacterium]
MVDFGRPNDQNLVNDLGGRWRVTKVQFKPRNSSGNPIVDLPNPQGYFQFDHCKLKESGNGSCPGVYEIEGVRQNFTYTADRQPLEQLDEFYINVFNAPDPKIAFWGRTRINSLGRRELVFVTNVSYQIPGVPALNDPVAEVTLAKE